MLLFATATSAIPQPSLAIASPASGQVATDRAQLSRALGRLAASKARVERLRERLASTSRRLDAIVERENRLHTQLSGRVRAMYRGGETPFIAVLMNARTYEDFANTWVLLGRVNRRDAELLRELARTRREAAESADALMTLQTKAAKELDAQRAEVSRARRELAGSAAALAAYQARVQASSSVRIASSKRTASGGSAKTDSTQGLTGSGDWKSGLASHYGRNFSGRGASGQHIGPYSMIVAHKTLPFGTLVEVRYNGKRAVARVADRGPYHGGRIFDLGPGVIRVLGFSGVHTVSYRVIGR